METGIIAIQNIVNQPLTRRMNTGSPWIDAHNDFITPTKVPFLMPTGFGAGRTLGLRPLNVCRYLLPRIVMRASAGASVWR